MSTIPLTAFLSGFDAIAAERPAYKMGGDGSGGTCDCIGLIIGAIRRSGGTWSGIHGSNYAARSEMDYLLPVTDAADLRIGELVFKAASPGQTNYALPGRYGGHPDQKDYYHVGFVRCVEPLRIVHCTSPVGITTDTRLGNWTYHGWLKKISQEGEQPVNETKRATVIADSGSTVNLRKSPGGALVQRIPVGAEVIVTSLQDGWARVSYQGTSGWVQERFVALDEEAAGEDVVIALPHAMALHLRDALADVLGWG